MKTETTHNVTILIKTWNIFKKQIEVLHNKYEIVTALVSITNDTVSINDVEIRRSANALTLTNVNQHKILTILSQIQNLVVDGVKNISYQNINDFEDFIYTLLTKNEPDIYSIPNDVFFDLRS
jgi:hypothetical protein